MAKRTTQRAAAGRKSGKASGSRRSSTALERNYRNYRDTLLEWSERPAVKYVAGGLGLAVLGRFAYQLSDRYPEIARFIKENIDTVEDKLREFRGIGSQEENVEARH